MRETSKEIQIGDERYRVGKMPAETAAKIHNMLMACAIRARDESKGDADSDAPDEAMSPEERADGTVAFLWTLASDSLEDKVYSRVQHQCLLACTKVTPEGSAVPIRMLDGRWAAKELAEDGPAVDRLVTETLQFNIAAFFLARLSRQAAVTGQAGKPQNP